MGLRLLIRSGVRVAWITGSRAPVVTHRARALGIDRVVLGAEDKLTPWEALRGELELPAEVCAHIGDDLPDIPVLAACGFAYHGPKGHIAFAPRLTPAQFFILRYPQDWKTIFGLLAQPRAGVRR
mgnify:CR=1 FL=1